MSSIAYCFGTRLKTTVLSGFDSYIACASYTALFLYCSDLWRVFHWCISQLIQCSITKMNLLDSASSLRSRPFVFIFFISRFLFSFNSLTSSYIWIWPGISYHYSLASSCTLFYYACFALILPFWFILFMNLSFLSWPSLRCSWCMIDPGSAFHWPFASFTFAVFFATKPFVFILRIFYSFLAFISLTSSLRIMASGNSFHYSTAYFLIYFLYKVFFLSIIKFLILF